MYERCFFPDKVRLYLQKEIDRLFASGQSLVAYPLRIVYLPFNGIPASGSTISILVSVPKKLMKHAVKRNRIKRLIRESFRLNYNATAELYAKNGKYLHIAYIYICKELKPFTEIEKAVLKSFEIFQHL